MNLDAYKTGMKLTLGGTQNDAPQMIEILRAPYHHQFFECASTAQFAHFLDVVADNAVPSGALLPLLDVNVLLC